MSQSECQYGKNNVELFIPFSDDVIDIVGGKDEIAIYKITIRKEIDDNNIEDSFKQNFTCNQNCSLDGPWDQYDQETKDILLEYRCQGFNYELKQTDSDLYVFY